VSIFTNLIQSLEWAELDGVGKFVQQREDANMPISGTPTRPFVVSFSTFLIQISAVLSNQTWFQTSGLALISSS
jgi:hypothetical protein